MFQHILVPLDGSLCAERALPVAARIARATGGSLLLAQAVSPPIDFSGGLAQVPFMSEQFIETETADATDYLNAMAASPLLAGITLTTEVVFGTPAQHLIASAEAHESDLVVLCRHGRSGLSRWALGSVTHTLVHQSTVPVLVLRQREEPSPPSCRDSAHPLSALVPLDGSPLAEAALSPAAHLIAALAAPEQGALHLVQVVRDIPATGGGTSKYKEALCQARTYLAAAAERLQATEKDLALSLTSSIEVASDVASTLVNLAEDGSEAKEAGSAGGCDLIAISTHGRGGLARWVMGSVTERLLNTTRLPMLIVRPQHKG
jgi:nucleotide-binding universal stress UspA family protein